MVFQLQADERWAAKKLGCGLAGAHRAPQCGKAKAVDSPQGAAEQALVHLESKIREQALACAYAA